MYINTVNLDVFGLLNFREGLFASADLQNVRGS